MARKTVAQATQKWQTNVARSGEYYRQGVQTTQNDWATNAQEASERRDAGLRAAMADGRINAGIQRAGTEKWRANTLSKGVNNWTQNTPQAGPKYAQGLQRAYGYQDYAEQQTAQMSRNTRQDRVARAAAYQLAVGEAADRDKGRV